MAAQRKEINLLPQESWEKRPIGRFIKWALTFGRYIVITTELIVIIAFISRFSLDRNLSDLYEEIQIKQAQIKSVESFEKEFRSIQKRLIVIADLEQRKTYPDKILAGFSSMIPLNVTLDKLSFEKNTLSLSGHALSESGLSTLIYNLSKSPNFTDIEIEDIAQEPTLEISFKLKAMAKTS